MEQWITGTNAQALRVKRTVMIALCAVPAAIGLLCGDLVQGIVIGLFFLVIWSPFLFVMGGRISRIERCQKLLESGSYVLTDAVCLRVGSSRYSAHYVGYAKAQLRDGQILSRLAMPHRVARCRRGKSSFAIYVVCLEGEKGLLAFVRNG